MYFETQVTTTSPGQILLMLYDGAIKFLVQAKERIEAKDYKNKGILISSAIDVINELASSLNREKGKDLAANLGQLYFYCNKRLFMANSRMDTAPIDEVIKILSGIRSAYAQIIDTPEAVAAMATKTAAQPAGNGMRAPVGTQAAPMAGAPVAKSRVRSAYAVQGAMSRAEETADAPEARQPPQQLSTQPVARTVESAPHAAKAVAEVPETMPVKAPETPQAAPLPPLDMDDDTPPAAFTQTKRLAASNLYRKFAS